MTGSSILSDTDKMPFGKHKDVPIRDGIALPNYRGGQYANGKPDPRAANAEHEPRAVASRASCSCSAVEYDYCPECRGQFSFNKPVNGACPWCGYRFAGPERTAMTTALLAETLTLLDRIYATWCSDASGNDLVDALDPLMEDTKRFLEAHTANAQAHQTPERSGGGMVPPVVGTSGREDGDA